MRTSQHIEAASQLICHDFELPNMHFDDIKRLREWLATMVATLMETNMERLLYALYRIDVCEQKAYIALGNQTDEAPHYALADLIIEREIQKVQSRIWYKERQQGEIDDSDAERW